jgi:hypothetical protein
MQKSCKGYMFAYQIFYYVVVPSVMIGLTAVNTVGNAIRGNFSKQHKAKVIQTAQQVPVQSAQQSDEEKDLINKLSNLELSQQSFVNSTDQLKPYQLTNTLSTK